MTREIKINLPYITRVEGHGNVVVNVKEGRVEEMRLEIVESPRFFEAMLVGRSIVEAPPLTSRICGICAISHTEASLKACEMALGVEVAEETVALRKLLLNAELMQSHILHLLFLVLPDFRGAPSIIALKETEPETVKLALRLKATANDIATHLVGRHVHPVGMAIGGFRRWPSKKDFRAVRAVVEAALPDIAKAVSLFKDIETPEFPRSANYASLSSDKEYALYDGRLVTSGGETREVCDYRELITEEVVAHSTAKHSRIGGKAVAVGALARLSNNFDHLNKEAKAAAKTLGLPRPSSHLTTGPYLNNPAQLVECVHALYDSLSILDYLDKAKDPGTGEVRLRSGRGVGAVEAPRGTLYHEYETDKDGVITKTNCVIPTAQNLLNIEEDMRELVPLIIETGKETIAKRLEMLVRAYDPCISCSTHLIKVDFIE